MSTTGINPSVLNHIMEWLLFFHSTVNFKSVDMVELSHRTNFLGLKKLFKKKRERQEELFFICILLNLATILKG